MAVLSAVPRSFYDDHKTTLKSSMTSTTQTSSIVLNALSRNAATATWAATGGGVLRFYNDTQVEHIGFGSATVDSTTKEITLVDVTRDLPFNDSSTATGWTTAAAGIKWPAGTKVELVWDARHAQQTVFLDQANTGGTNFAIRGSSTTIPSIRHNTMTTAQRDAVASPANGDMIYNSTTGEMNQYVAGAWTTVGDTGTSNASTTVAGKVEIATAAERAAGTSTGGTGAILVPSNDALVKTSSGAGDENKIPILNASGQLADGYLGSGSASASNYLLGNRTWGTVSAIGDKFFGTGADGAVTWSSSTNLNPATDFNYTTSTLNAGQTLSVSAVNDVLIIKSNSNVTINGTVDLNGKGGAGVTGGSGNSAAATAGVSIVSGWTNGAGQGTAGATSNGGGGGGSSSYNNGTAGGNGGGTGGAAGTAIDGKQWSALQGMFRGVACGGGASAGGGHAGGTGGNGGAGGGALVWFIGGNLTLGGSSIIRANGADGSAGTAGGGTAGGGGGGGGGTILIIVAGTITNSGVTVSASGGTGGAAAGGGGTGGNGGTGKVLIYSLSDGTVIAG